MKDEMHVHFLRVAFVSLLLLNAGCGSSGPFEYVPVTGKIMYKDDTPIPADRIRLIFFADAPPKDKQTYPRPGNADVDVADGTFDFVTSHKPGDGLIPGKHKVVVEAYDENERMLPVVGAEYRSVETTPLEVDTAKLPFDIKITKPDAKGRLKNKLGI